MGKKDDSYPKSTDGERVWINDIELEDAQIKWAFSHFDGKADDFNDEGDHNFQVIIPPEDAEKYAAVGWNIRTMEPREEGDPAEHLLKVKIGRKYGPPPIYIIKGDRRYRADEADLPDIRRSTCERIDVIISPSRWVNGNRTGITGYVKEMYVKIRESRFAKMYDDYEEVK